MVRVRFAPSPSGSLHVGSALTAVANRRFADDHDGVLVLRIDDTDAARVDPAAEAAIRVDLAWLGVEVDEGPVRQSERGDLYRAAVERLVAAGAAYEEGSTIRFRGCHDPTLLRADGSATYHAASVVDDLDLRITHVIRGRDHLPNQALHERLARALGAEPPAYVHHGLVAGPDGRKLSKRHGASSVGDLRDGGIPAAAVRAYLEELGLPHADVRLDPARIERLSIEAIGRMGDEELAAAADAPSSLAAALRGARTLVEATSMARQILDRPAPPAAPLDERSALTLLRFVELREALPGMLDRDAAHGLIRELKAVGGDLRALRRALTGAERGPELWAVVLALPRAEASARARAALA